MKILIYDNAFHIVNGASKYILSVAEMLSGIGEVYLLGDVPFSLDFLRYFYGINFTPRQLLGLSFRESKGTFRKLKDNWMHIKKCMRISEISEGYDLFINNNAGFHYQIKPRSSKSLMMFHFLMDPFHSFHYPERFKKIKNIARRVLLPNPEKYNFISCYGRIICNSELSKKWVIRWFRKEDVEIINPPICLPDNYNFQKENLILSVGRFAPLSRDRDGKGRDRMVGVFKTLCDKGIKNYSLILAGGKVLHEETQRYIERLREISKGYPIEFYFDLDRSSLNELYSRTKIFWHLMGLGINEENEPYKLEPFGMVTAEAMSYGAVPVVVNAGGQREIVESGKSGFLIDNLEELIDRTKYLCENEVEYARFSQQAKERSKLFSKDRFIAQWRNVFFQMGINIA